MVTAAGELLSASALDAVNNVNSVSVSARRTIVRDVARVTLSKHVTTSASRTVSLAWVRGDCVHVVEVAPFGFPA